MHDDARRFIDATRPWTSTAGRGPELRGRRTETADTTLHFIHGNGFSGGVYWPFLEHFVPRYGLFCHDVEGHGASTAPDRYSGIDAVIARVPEVIGDQLGDARRLVGIGHSFGGAVTLAVAARNPGLFDRIVLLDPILMPPATWLAIRAANVLGRNMIANATLRRRDRWPSREDVVERLRGRGIYSGWTEAALWSFVEHATRDDPAGGGRQLCCPRELEASIYKQPIWAWRLLPQVQCPVLMIYGRSSYGFMRPAARRAERLNPRVTIETAEGGHCFMLEHPRVAAEQVMRFIDANRRT